MSHWSIDVLENRNTHATRIGSGMLHMILGEVGSSPCRAVFAVWPYLCTNPQAAITAGHLAMQR